MVRPWWKNPSLLDPYSRLHSCNGCSPIHNIYSSERGFLFNDSRLWRVCRESKSASGYSGPIKAELFTNQGRYPHHSDSKKSYTKQIFQSSPTWESIPLSFTSRNKLINPFARPCRVFKTAVKIIAITDQRANCIWNSPIASDWKAQALPVGYPGVLKRSSSIDELP